MTVDERPDSLGTFKAFSIAEGILLIVLGILALIFPVIASFWTTGVDCCAVRCGRRDRLDQQPGAFRAYGSLDLLLASGGFDPLSGRRRLDDQRSGILWKRPSRWRPLPWPSASFSLLKGLWPSSTVWLNTNRPGAGWAIANGVITFVLGLLIVTLKFWGLLWVLGTLVGISFLFSGLELIIFSSTLHDDQDPPAVA